MGYTWQYYDLVLLAIAASMGLGIVVGLFTPLSLVLSVLAFGTVTMAVMAHAMFVNGPVDEPADLADEVEGLN